MSFQKKKRPPILSETKQTRRPSCRFYFRTKTFVEYIPSEHKSEQRKLYEVLVKNREDFHKYGMPNKLKQQKLSMSRATYYQRKQWLETGVFKSKAPIHVRQSKFSKETQDQIAQMRKEHPTYGKSKIKVLFDKLETGVKISESSIDRILKKLKIPKSNTAPRQKRHRDFSKTHAKAFRFKRYADMLFGAKVQIDHMSVQGVFKELSILLPLIVNRRPFTAMSIPKRIVKQLEVLPPSKPQYNIERRHKTVREEFYAFCKEDSIMGKRLNLKEFVDDYNKNSCSALINHITSYESLEKTKSLKKNE